MPASVIISTIISGASGYFLGAAGFAAFTKAALIAGLKAGVLTGALGGMLQMVTGAGRQSARAGGNSSRRQQVSESISARWLVGRQRASGQIVFFGEDPDNGLALHMMMVICEGAIEGIERLYVDGEEVPLVATKDEDEPVAGRVFSNQIMYAKPGSRFRPDKSGDGHITVQLSNNAEGRNETPLGDKFSDWQASDKLQGLSYVHIVLWQNGDQQKPFYRRVPNIEFLIKGIKVALPGPGETGEMPPVWTNNAADIRYWWYRVRRGFPEEAIDRAAYRAARIVCARQVSRTEDTTITQPQYTIDGTITSEDDAAEIESLMDFAWQGSAVEVDGKIRFLPGAVRTSTLTIGEDWIKSRGPITISPPLQQRYNGFTARLVQAKDKGYQESDVPEFIDEDARERDGEARTADFGALPFTTDIQQGTWLTVVQARRARDARVWNYSYMPSPPDGSAFTAFQVYPGMTVQFNDSEYGLTNQLAEVISTKIQPDMSVDAVLQEVKAEFFNPLLTLPDTTDISPPSPQPFFFVGGSPTGLYRVNALTGGATTLDSTGDYKDMFASPWEGGHVYRYTSGRVDRIDVTNGGAVTKTWVVTDGPAAVVSTAISPNGVVAIKEANPDGNLFIADLSAAEASLDDNENVIYTTTAEEHALTTRFREINGLSYIGDTMYAIVTRTGTNPGMNDHYLYTISFPSARIVSTLVGSKFEAPDSTVIKGVCTLDDTLFALVSETGGFFIYQINKDTNVWTKFIDDPLEDVGTDNVSIELIPGSTIYPDLPDVPPVIFTVNTLDDGTRRYYWVNEGREARYAGVKIRYALSDIGWYDGMLDLHQGLLNFSPWESQLPSTANNIQVWFEIRNVDYGGEASLVGKRVMATLGLPPTGSVGPFLGDWTAGVDYKQRDTVRYTIVGGEEINGLYRCIRDHTSTTSNRPPNATFWDLYLLDGRFGEDGFGSERIFTRTATPSLPQSKRPDNAWGYDSPGTADNQVWSDNAQSVSTSLRYQWMAVRKIEGQPNTGDAVTDNWREPVIISSWGSGEKGDTGLPGTDGSDGQGFETIFANTAEGPPLGSTNYPDNNWLFDAGGTAAGGVVWTDGHRTSPRTRGSSGGPAEPSKEMYRILATTMQT